MGDSLRLLDATRIRLSSLSGGWADMVGGRRAIKVHLTYDPLADLPLAATVTGQRTNDILVGRMAEILPGVTYVFDLAYYDFAWWATIDQGGARFVTRLKTNTPVTLVEQTRFAKRPRNTDGSSRMRSATCPSASRAPDAIPSASRSASSPSN